MWLLISTDDFENLEFDEGLEQILEEICKSGLMSKNNNNNVLYHLYS